MNGDDNEWGDVFISSSSSTAVQPVAVATTTMSGNNSQQGNDQFSNPLSTTTTNNHRQTIGSSFGGGVNNSYSTDISSLMRNDPVLIEVSSNNNSSNLIGLHEPTLNDLVNNNGHGLKSKIKDKLKRKKKKGGVRFQDEANDDEDYTSSDEDDAGKSEKVKPSLPLQKQDTNEKGFTEVILPPLPENRAINNLSSQTTINNNGSSTSAPVAEEPVSKLLKGDTPHWLFILSFVVPTIVVCSILAAVQLGVCAYLFEQINTDPTFKNDPNALTWDHNCTLVDISNDCAERGKYLDRGTYCYFDVKFPSRKNLTDPTRVSDIVELTTFLPYNMEETGIYFPMKVGDAVLCYTNKKEDLVNIIEPISTRYEAYYVAGGILGVFGSISVVAAVCVIPTAFVRPKNRIY